MVSVMPVAATARSAAARSVPCTSTVVRSSEAEGRRAPRRGGLRGRPGRGGLGGQGRGERSGGEEPLPRAGARIGASGVPPGSTVRLAGQRAPGREVTPGARSGRGDADLPLAEGLHEERVVVADRVAVVDPPVGQPGGELTPAAVQRLGRSPPPPGSRRGPARCPRRRRSGSWPSPGRAGRPPRAMSSGSVQLGPVEVDLVRRDLRDDVAHPVDACVWPSSGSVWTCSARWLTTVRCPSCSK